MKNIIKSYYQILIVITFLFVFITGCDHDVELGMVEDNVPQQAIEGEVNKGNVEDNNSSEINAEDAKDADEFAVAIPVEDEELELIEIEDEVAINVTKEDVSGLIYNEKPVEIPEEALELEWLFAEIRYPFFIVHGPGFEYGKVFDIKEGGKVISLNDDLLEPLIRDWSKIGGEYVNLPEKIQFGPEWLHYISHVSYSPSGDKIAITVENTGDLYAHTAVGFMDLTDGEVYFTNIFRWSAENLVWSPNSEYLGYNSSLGSVSSVYGLYVDSVSEIKNITAYEGYELREIIREIYDAGASGVLIEELEWLEDSSAIRFVTIRNFSLEEPKELLIHIDDESK